MDINNVPAVDEHPLSFPIPLTPASLKIIAANTVVLNLWHLKGSLDSDSFSCTDYLAIPLPSCLKELIDRRIILIGRQLTILNKSFFLPGILRDDVAFFKYFDSITFATEDELWPEKSAMKLIKNEELTNLEKFKIACIYWMEDDIRTIWPSVSEELDDGEDLDPFTRYWQIEMRGGRTDDNPITLNFVRSLMSKNTQCGNWTALIRLLNKLPRQDQFNGLTEFIRYHSPIKYLLPKLNREQANHVLRHQPDEIISKLASQKECFRYVLKIWNLAKESISAECFVKLLNYLCYGGFICDQWGKCHQEAAQVRLVLFVIWNTAPSEKKAEIFEDFGLFNELKLFSWMSGYDIDYDRSRILYFYNRSLYLELPKYFMERKSVNLYFPICLDYEMDFFFKFFEEMPQDLRAFMWRTHWRKFILRSKSEILNRFLRLCVVNEDEIRRFVEEEMFILSKIKSIVDSWLKQKFYNEVIDYSNLCTWNMQLAEGFRRQVFLNMVPSLEDVSCDKLIEVAADIDGNFSNVDIAKDIKRTIFLSDKVKKIFMSRLSKGSKKEAISVIECFLKTERSQPENQLLLDLWFNFLIDGQDNEFDGRWEEFLSWWEGKGEEWPIFKQFLNVDEIFIKLLLETVPNLGMWLDPVETEESEISPSKKIKRDEFAYVDDFLTWYFGSEEGVKNYKLEKISNYQMIPALKNIIRMYNECITDKVLEWFFNGDFVKVNNFKTNFKNIRN